MEATSQWCSDLKTSSLIETVKGRDQCLKQVYIQHTIYLSMLQWINKVVTVL